MSIADRLRSTVRLDVLPGAAAGLIGGLAFGLAWIELGVLPSVATLVRAESDVVGLFVHLSIAAIVGAGLGLLLRGRRGAGDTVLWGVTYGAFFWFLGPLTLQPIILGDVPAWDVGAAQAGFPSLLGHILFGAVAAVALVVIRGLMAQRDASGPHSEVEDMAAERSVGRGAVLRGVIAGVVGYLLVSLVPLGQDRMLSTTSQGDLPGSGSLSALLIAVLFGALVAAAQPTSAPTVGASLIRGAGFGFLLWVVGGLTLLPVLRGEGLAWSVPDAQAAFPLLVASILFGVTTCLVFHWLTRLTPILFSDDDPDVPADGGSWGLRAVVRGAAAGLVGAVIFTLVMVQIGFLPVVANLVGSDSEVVGLIVHLLIGVAIGATFGLFFRRQAFDAGAAVGWGTAYGFVWWLLGPLTLAPIIAGAEPAWSVAAAAAAFPGLIGHLAYGAGLGLTFYWLESRYTPWWISRTERELDRMAGRRRAAMSAGPALWALLVLVAVLLPIVLATPMSETPAGPYDATGDSTPSVGRDMI